MFTEDLLSIEGGVGLLYNIAFCLVGLILLYGYAYYLGSKTGENYKLEEVGRFDLKLYVGVVGYSIIFFILFVFCIIFSTEYSYVFDNLAENDGFVNFVKFVYLFIFVLIVYAILIKSWLKVVWNGKKEIKSFALTCVGGVVAMIGVLLVLDTIFQIPITRKYFISWLPLVSLLFFFGAVPIYSYIKGSERNGEDVYVTVKLSSGEAKPNLILYQTTKTDYRFITKDGKEIIIPMGGVKEIIYAPEKEEKKE